VGVHGNGQDADEEDAAGLKIAAPGPGPIIRGGTDGTSEPGAAGGYAGTGSQDAPETSISTPVPLHPSQVVPWGQATPCPLQQRQSFILIPS
jgi:hypothetical protein